MATTDLNNSKQSQNKIYRNLIKRVIDLGIVIASLPFVIPLVAILALIIACDGGNPFYLQDRIGRGGKIYRIWKLRTMVVHADTHLKSYLKDNPAATVEWNTTQKLKQDPRITGFGQFLRKSSMDELPQLFNVLKGDMSLVGPRPMMTKQKPLYPGTAYYDLRPGISGYWQISDRNQTSFADRAFYDTRYNADVSMWTDFKIVVATFSVVIRGTGY